MSVTKRSILKLLILAATITVAEVLHPIKVGADDGAKNLNWPCITIQTEAHSSTELPPVASGVSIQPNGDLVAVVGDDHVVGIYDRKLGKFAKHLRNHTDWVRVAKFSPDGKLLATAGNDGRLLLWQTDNWSNPVELAHFSFALVDIDFHPNSSQIAVVGFENQLSVLDVATRRSVSRIDCPCRDMRTIQYSPSGQYIAGGGRNGKIEIWDTASQKSIQKLQVHQQRIRSIAFVDDQTIVSCGDDRKVKVLKIGTSSVTELPLKNSKLFDIAVLGQDTIATCGTDNAIHIWSLTEASLIGVLSGHNGSVSCMDINGATLISGSFDTSIRIWTTNQDASLSVPSQPRFGAGNGFDPQWQQRSGSSQFQTIK
jgi:WD40 repeat protein